MQVPRESKKISWKVPAGFSLVVLLTIGVFQIVISNRSGTTPATEIAQPSQSDTPSPSPTQSQSPTPVATATPPPIVSASTTPQTGPVSLTISATRGNSYIDVIVDGKRSMKGSLFQGDSKSFQGVKSVSIYLSNPAGLDLTLNGKPLAPLGGQNEEVRRTFR